MMDVKDRIRTILLLEEMQKNKEMSKSLGLVDKSKFGVEDYRNDNKKDSIDISHINV
ncbi:hypothetical protein [Oribacterium sp. C9]|uniref:hypothetical protein n=1 Tax=Oribacterium sp. C9 TaxID=1943579 RepID=UPI001438AF6E|nr:hypothetical protein [Oribacterium sp. C9]